jgi:hypothetical protein
MPVIPISLERFNRPGSMLRPWIWCPLVLKRQACGIPRSTIGAKRTCPSRRGPNRSSPMGLAPNLEWSRCCPVRTLIASLEQAIEAALSPGSFISYNDAWSFVDDVQNVADAIEKITKKEPERAAHLFETFIAACHEKADEIDDSSGNFGMLVEDLFRDWIKARQAANHDPNVTARLLLSWMEEDPYGFCHDLDREAVKVLDKMGLEAFARQIRAKFESALSQDDKAKRFPGYARRRWGGALKTLLASQRNVDDYIALCEQTELSAKDCIAIAEIYRSRRRPADALAWVEQGLEIAPVGQPKILWRTRSARDETGAAGQARPPGRCAPISLVRV